MAHHRSTRQVCLLQRATPSVCVLEGLVVMELGVAAAEADVVVVEADATVPEVKAENIAATAHLDSHTFEFLFDLTSCTSLEVFLLPFSD